MIKGSQFLFITFFCFFSSLNAQTEEKILINNRWSIFDNFAVIDFSANGKAEIQYAYCTYCQGNSEVLDWKLKGEILKLGKDSLKVKKIDETEILTSQYGQIFTLKNIKTLKNTKQKKENILKFLTSKNQLTVSVKSEDFVNTNVQSAHFDKNGKMWLGQEKFRGQWALKSFYGDLFLIYIHRNTVNRDFPLLKVKNLKKGKLVGEPIFTIKNGRPFSLEFSNKG